MTFTAFLFRKLGTLKICLDKCQEIPVSEGLLTSSMVNVPKHCWNLHHSIFIIFIDPCITNSVPKSLSYWHAKCWDCLLTHLLPMKTRFNFEHFDRKDDPHTLCISEITYSENVVREMYKKFCFRDLLRTNMVNVLKHCWNLPHSTFIIFTGQENFVGKSLSYWHGKSWDCFLTHCTPMKSIFLIIGTI